MQQETDSRSAFNRIMRILMIILVLFLCWYFRSILLYIALAAVVSLICRPLTKLLSRVSVLGHRLPRWLIAVISILIVFIILLAVITRIFPVIGSLIAGVTANMGSVTSGIYPLMSWFDHVNLRLIEWFPSLGEDFMIQSSMMDWTSKAFDFSNLSSMVGSVALAVGGIAVGIFSVVFIGFFFVRDERLLSRIIGALVPDSIEHEVTVAIGEIEHLLSRYFVGMVIEILGVTLLNFIGLWLVARVGVNAAIGIAFMTGILNIIPYLGPWIGAAIGTLLGVVIRLSSTAGAASPSMGLIIFALIAVFCFTQLVDNFVFQPLIYSKSIKSSPLEIFIVLLMAATLGGTVGMIVAIPAYTVLRVIASRFLSHKKPVKRLMDATS